MQLLRHLAHFKITPDVHFLLPHLQSSETYVHGEVSRQREGEDFLRGSRSRIELVGQCVLRSWKRELYVRRGLVPNGERGRVTGRNPPPFMKQIYCSACCVAEVHCRAWVLGLHRDIKLWLRARRPGDCNVINAEMGGARVCEEVEGENAA